MPHNQVQKKKKKLFWKVKGVKGAFNIIWKQAVSLDAFLRYGVGGNMDFVVDPIFFHLKT